MQPSKPAGQTYQTLRAARLAWQRQARLVTELQSTYEEALAKKEALETSDATVSKVAAQLSTVEVELQVLSRRLADARSCLEQLGGSLLKAASAGLQFVGLYAARKEAELKTAALKALRPFCDSECDARTLLTQLPKVRYWNHFERELAHQLEGDASLKAIEQIEQILQHESKPETKPVTAATRRASRAK